MTDRTDPLTSEDLDRLEAECRDVVRLYGEKGWLPIHANRDLRLIAYARAQARRAEDLDNVITYIGDQMARYARRADDLQRQYMFQFEEWERERENAIRLTDKLREMEERARRAEAVGDAGKGWADCLHHVEIIEVVGDLGGTVPGRVACNGCTDRLLAALDAATGEG